MKPYGIRVCALCPGSTESEFHTVRVRKNSSAMPKPPKNGTHRIEDLTAGKSYVISGLGNYLGAHGERLVPAASSQKIAGNMFKPEKK